MCLVFNQDQINLWLSTLFVCMQSLPGSQLLMGFLGPQNLEYICSWTFSFPEVILASASHQAVLAEPV